jgi:hypothetical protein
VPYQQKALFTVDNQKLVGVVQRLSLTGGSALLMRGTIAEGTLGEILFATACEKVMHILNSCMWVRTAVPLPQAFALIRMDATSNPCLTKALEEMNTSEFSDDVRERTQTDVAFEMLRQSMRQLSGMLSSVRRTRLKG